MIKIGTIKKAKDAGVGKTSHKVQWLECPKCGGKRWVWLRNGKPQSKWCYQCGRREGKPRGALPREKHPRWKGGRHISPNGYIRLMIPLDSEFIKMADAKGRIFEHRYIMAKHLGKCLKSDEEVHHINRNKHDNRIGNLSLKLKKGHMKEHYEEISKLREEVYRLREKLREAGIA